MTRRGTITVAAGIALLVLLGVSASIIRAYGTIDGVTAAGPTPELTRFDWLAFETLAALLGIERGTTAWDDAEEQHRRFLRKFNANPGTTLAHVLPAALFMTLVPLQFSRRIRTRYVRLHRASGRLIILLAIPLGLSGMYFGARMPFGGLVEATATTLFGTWFFSSLCCAFVAIRRGDVAGHRRWMIRMWSVALGVSMQRVIGTILLFTTREAPELWFGPSIWMGFATTVALGELWIRATRSESAAPSEAPQAAAIGV